MRRTASMQPPRRSLYCQAPTPPEPTRLVRLAKQAARRRFDEHPYPWSYLNGQLIDSNNNPVPPNLPLGMLTLFATILMAEEHNK